MNGMDEEQMGPQTFLYGCELKSGKDVVFNPEEDDFEHQLDLRMVCVDHTTKNELHIVEVEGQDTEGQKVKAVLASLKPSTLPSVCLGGFAITPPAVFRLKAGSGPIHISGQHLVIMGGDQSFDEDEDEEEEVQASKKRPASAPALKSHKKIKMDEEEDDEDDEDEEDEDEEESEVDESPVKPIKTPTKPQPHAQNGKKANTPVAKQQAKTPDSKEKGPKKPQTPKTPQVPLTIPELKAKMLASVEKGVSLPKLQPKFENFLKNGMKVSDTKIVQELWKWRQTLADAK